MSVETYIGNPPANAVAWIKAHSQPAGHAKTIFTFTRNRTVSKNISGELGLSIWNDSNLDYDGPDNLSRNNLMLVDIGNIVTSIGLFAFSVCSSLTSVTFLGKTLAQVQEMDNYSWGISNTSIIHVA